MNDDTRQLIAKIEEVVCRHPEKITKEGVLLEQKNTLPFNYMSTFGVRIRLHCASPVIYDLDVFAVNETSTCTYSTAVLVRRKAREMRRYIRGRQSHPKRRFFERHPCNGEPACIVPDKPLEQVINDALVDISIEFYAQR